MQLLDYLKEIGEDGDDFAKTCGTSLGQLKQIAYGHRKAREKLCIAIERESERLVTCEELRPDVDWNYLRNTAA